LRAVALPFETTAQADLREGFVGQERALRALKMGVELTAPGYNVFVCGLSGTSRGGTIARMIGELHPGTKESSDRCYVIIQDRRPPAPLDTPAWPGQFFPYKTCRPVSIFSAAAFPRFSRRTVSAPKRVASSNGSTAREKDLMDDFTRKIAREQFALGHMQVGAVALPEIFPVLEGQMVPHRGTFQNGS